MKQIISGSALALMLLTATPAAAEVGGTITRSVTPVTVIDTILKTVLEFFVWESNIGTIDFVDGRVSASAGCNGLGGEYTVVGGTLTFGEFMSTLMACEDDIMQKEQALNSVLANTTAMTFKDGALVLTQKDGTTAAFKATLPQTTN